MTAKPEVQGPASALLRQVAEVGSALCAYMPGHGNPEAWPSSRCDCKYGASGRGEQNGCAEMRSVYRMLSKTGTDVSLMLGVMPSHCASVSHPKAEEA